MANIYNQIYDQSLFKPPSPRFQRNDGMKQKSTNHSFIFVTVGETIVGKKAQKSSIIDRGLFIGLFESTNTNSYLLFIH